MIKTRLVGAAAALTLAFVASARANADSNTFKYDSIGRLSQGCAARASDGELTRYTYDRAGNRTMYSNQKTDIALTANSGIYSADGRFVLWMQPDGNLVMYYNYGSGWATLGWATNTSGSGAYVAYLQSDGNLVLYNTSGTPVWASNTNQYLCATIGVGNDGNATIRSADGAVVWATNTGGH